MSRGTLSHVSVIFGSLPQNLTLMARQRTNYTFVINIFGSEQHLMNRCCNKCDQRFDRYSYLMWL